MVQGEKSLKKRSVKKMALKCPQEHDERESGTPEPKDTNDPTFLDKGDKLSSESGSVQNVERDDVSFSTKIGHPEKKNVNLLKPCIENNVVKTLNGDNLGSNCQDVQDEFQVESECAHRPSLLHVSTNGPTLSDTEEEMTALGCRPELSGRYKAADNHTHFYIVETGYLQIGNGNNMCVKRTGQTLQSVAAEMSTLGEDTDEFITATLVPPDSGRFQIDNGNDIPSNNLSEDEDPSAPSPELMPIIRGTKDRYSGPIKDIACIHSSTRAGQDETESSSFPCKDLPSYNDLITELSEDEEQKEGFLEKPPESPTQFSLQDHEKDERRCFLCCWKKMT